MGPRPFGRGRKATGLEAILESFSFNGAATFRSRKGLAAAADRAGRGASMGPRPFGRGRAGVRVCHRLQAGGFNGAATFRSRKV